MVSPSAGRVDAQASRLADLARRSRPAARVLELLEVRATRIDAELLGPGIDPPYIVQTGLSGGFGIAGARVGIDIYYDFTARSEAGADVWRVALALHLEYALIDGAEMPPMDAVEAYSATAAPFMAHPFAREAIHTLTTRLGVPPFVLPVMRSVADAALDDATGDDPATPP